MSEQLKTKTITILVSFQHSNKLLINTIQSLATQTHQNIVISIIATKEIKDVKRLALPVMVQACASIPSGYNTALKNITSPYIVFMNEGDVFEDKHFLESQIAVLEGVTQQVEYQQVESTNPNKQPLYTLQSECIDAQNVNIVIPKNFCISPLLRKTPLEHRFSKDFIKGVYAIDLHKNFFALQTSLTGCLIRTNALEGYTFPEAVAYEYEIDCMLRLLLKESVYLVNEQASYMYYSPKENQVLYHLPAHHIEWYHNSIEKFLRPLIADMKTKDGLPPFLQNYLVYYIRCRFLTNLDNRNKKKINEGNADDYLLLLKEILQAIEDVYLLNQYKLIYLSKNPELHCILLNLKYGEGKVAYEYIDCVDEEGNPDIEMRFHGCLISSLSSHRFAINVMNYYNETLSLDGSLISIFRYSDLKYYASFEKEIVQVEDSDAYSLTKYFGIPTYRRITYHLEFLLDDRKDLQKLSFFAELNGKRYPLKISFNNHWSKLSKSPRYSYWRFHNYFCHHANNAILIKKATKMKVLKREIQLQLNLLRTFRKLSIRALLMRWLYWITHPYFKHKKIWLMLDKLYKGGDSSEYLYRYSAKLDDGIKKYYLINKDTLEYRELRKDGYKPLVNGSLLHKLVFLNADLVLITNSHLFPFNGYRKQTSKYIRGLCNFSSMCLQHGLTVQKCAMAQRRIIDNTTGYFLASKFEYDNLMHHAYGYQGFDYLHLTGIGRYDGLVSNDQKQLLITPTWRMYNALPVTTSEGEQRGYNPNFKNTTYFHVYNNLINNERLIECAKKLGYKIKYLLHPILSSQAEDFTPNPELEVIPSVGDLSYEKILTKSSLMVTDYSGVQFDFAYMRKPVLYFHPEELPPHYDDGIFFYDTMGFGEICTKTEELVDVLCAYMESDCAMKDEYRQRADNFFDYNDHNNCERIYHKIMDYQKQIDIDKLRVKK